MRIPASGVVLPPSSGTRRAGSHRPVAGEPAPRAAAAWFPARAGRVSGVVVLVASTVLVGLIVGVLPRIADSSPARSTTGDDPARLVDPLIGTAPQHADVIPGDGAGGAFPGA